MRTKFLFLFLGLGLILTSCSTEGADKVADEFHDKLNAGEIDYIMDNLISWGESSEDEKNSFRSALESVHAQGQHENRKKTSGWNKSMQNGVTTTKVSYTFETNGETIHERLVLVELDEGGWKVLAFAMHPDEDVVIDYVSDY